MRLTLKLTILAGFLFWGACTSDAAKEAVQAEAPELSPELQARVAFVSTLFDKDKIVDNFLNLDQRIEVRTIEAAPQASLLEYADEGFVLPETFVSRDSVMNTRDFMDVTQSTGMLVYHNGKIIYEEYQRGMTDTTTHISWSMAKSVVSLLMGIAIDEGLIESEADPVTKYVPLLKGSAYDGVTIKQCLQMSSGVRFDETYGDPNSDITRFSKSLALNMPFADFILTLEREREPGTYNHYVSMDTQVLGMVIDEAIGEKTLSDYLKEKIWDPAGMEHAARWIIDSKGMEMALGGLNITLRDYARLGLIFLNKGDYEGKRIVSEAWLEKSVTPDAPHLQPGENPLSSSLFGYGYQLWLPIQPNGGDFFLAGIYNQYIYIHPEKNLMIVKTSANPNFTSKSDHSKENYIDLFQSIAKAF